MSGIYIPGMEMPVDGWHKVIKIFSDGTVVSYYDSVELAKAIPVPEHGRLGDLDDVINDVRHYICGGCGDYFGPDAKTESCDYCGAMNLIKTIERKPSIIPADPPVMYYPQVPGTKPTVIAEEVYDEYTDTAGNRHWKGVLSGEHIIPADKEGEG